ncbi:MAG: OmpA family protein [Chitinophagaceae bacterium]
MKQSILVFAVASILLASCVSSKKYKSANAQIETLNGQVDGLNKQVADNQKIIGELKTENIQYSKEAEDCRKAKEAIAQRAENLNKALAEQGTSMEQIQERAATSLQRFVDQGAEVTYKNGLIHINFTDDFFFRSGGSNISTRGREALNTVAQALRENPRVTCFIVGHTDTTHVSGKADNWSLSTERANAVVRILHYTYNINPRRLTSAGKGKYSPVASNNTPEGRERNRRIEIILNPDLDRLWELSKNK